MRDAQDAYFAMLLRHEAAIFAIIFALCADDALIISLIFSRYAIDMAADTPFSQDDTLPSLMMPMAAMAQMLHFRHYAMLLPRCRCFRFHLPARYDA